MSYTSLIKDETVATPAFERIRSDATVSYRTTKRASNPKGNARTYFVMNQEVAKLAGFRKGAKVSLFSGTGRDEGKIRIVENAEGSYTITNDGPSNSLRIDTSRLKLRTTKTTKTAKVTSVAKGALTLSL